MVRLDDIGCPAGLFVATEGLEEAHIAIARQDAIYFYSSEGRGQCHAIEGDKSHIFWFRTYLVVVSKDPITYSSAKQLASTPQPPPAENVKQILTIFDIQNKFIAYSAPIKAIKALTSEWGLLYGLNDANDVLFQLVEKDIQSKLELLFKKNFYDIAIKIAKSHHYDNDGLKDIFRQYGNHLYSKGDNSGAIDNYIKTIGCLEPSYVIRKFLDAHKIHYLTAYLQALHTQGQANEDHTTLLLNCYTKLKDKSKLDEFIFKDREKIDFDVAVAIKVCRQANYYEHALALAKDHGFDDMYLEIIFDLKHYPQGLEYIQKLDMSQKLKSMQAYGSLLMKQLPQETTDFLKKVCVEEMPRGSARERITFVLRLAAPQGRPAGPGGVGPCPSFLLAGPPGLRQRLEHGPNSPSRVRAYGVCGGYSADRTYRATQPPHALPRCKAARDGPIRGPARLW